MVIKDIEREDIEFVCKTLGCRPIASLDHFTAENLVNVDLVEEVNESGGKYIKVSLNFLYQCNKPHSMLFNLPKTHYQHMSTIFDS